MRLSITLATIKQNNLGYWDWIEAVNENNAQNIAMELYQISKIKTFNSSEKEALDYLEKHPDLGLTRLLIKSGALNYLDVLTSLNFKEIIIQHLLDPKYFLPEIVKHKSLLSMTHYVPKELESIIQQVETDVDRVLELSSNPEEHYKLYDHINTRFASLLNSKNDELNCYIIFCISNNIKLKITISTPNIWEMQMLLHLCSPKGWVLKLGLCCISTLCITMMQTC